MPNRPRPPPPLRRRDDNRDRLRARVWKYPSCGYEVVADKPIPNPAPCPVCRGIVFKVIRG